MEFNTEATLRRIKNNKLTHKRPKLRLNSVRKSHKMVQNILEQPYHYHNPGVINLHSEHKAIYQNNEMFP